MTKKAVEQAVKQGVIEIVFSKKVDIITVSDRISHLEQLKRKGLIWFLSACRKI